MACRRSALGRHRHRRTRKWHAGIPAGASTQQDWQKKVVAAVAQLVFACCVCAYRMAQCCYQHHRRGHVGKQRAGASSAAAADGSFPGPEKQQRGTGE
eukprot:4393634-Alexandrium_andersonii.AAC.1